QNWTKQQFLAAMIQGLHTYGFYHLSLMMNLLDSHDTFRFLQACNGDLPRLMQAELWRDAAKPTNYQTTTCFLRTNMFVFAQQVGPMKNYQFINQIGAVAAAVLFIVSVVSGELTFVESAGKTGDGWVKIDYRKDIVPGSALDFSELGLLDAPAGKYGWVVPRNGHAEFEKRPGKAARFYGVNLCMTANYLSDEEIECFTDRLMRMNSRKPAAGGIRLRRVMPKRLFRLIL
ncbi:MAG: hypothetical protein R6V06_08045, partial [Kiritimatiellia bacterium]